MKLFRVVKEESNYRSSWVEWTKYFLVLDKETLMLVLRDRYGNLDKYYYNEEETHIRVYECEVETL